MVPVYLLLLGAIAVALESPDLCEGVNCHENGQCDSTTGACICHAGYTGPYCDVSDCGGHGVQHTYDDVCHCRAGWAGERCNQCQEPGKGYRFICIATSRHTNHPYALGYVTNRQYTEIMSGKLRLDVEARHSSIPPDHIGFDGRKYDCECRPERAAGASARQSIVDPYRRKKPDPRDAAYNALVTRYVEDTRFDAARLEAHEYFALRHIPADTSQCFGWMLATGVLAGTTVIFMGLMLCCAASRARARREFRNLQAYITNPPREGATPMAPSPAVPSSVSATRVGVALKVE